MSGKPNGKRRVTKKNGPVRKKAEAKKEAEARLTRALTLDASRGENAN